MAQTNSLAHTLHDLGAAAWFGGSLMGAIGLNAAASKASDVKERAPIADAGWARWAPVNFAGIAAHLIGGAVLTGGNKGRLRVQKGVAGTSVVKTGVTIAALGVTAYSRYLGKKIENAGAVAADGPTDPSPETPDDVAGYMRQLKIGQWLVPALSGGLIALSAYMNEQQRPSSVASGVLHRIMPGD